MKSVFRGLVAAFGFSVAIASIPACQAQTAADQATTTDTSVRMQQLEKEVEELRSEIAALKASSSSSATASSAVPASNAVASSTSPTPPAPSSPSLSGLLGSTTLSGFVDMYYGQNFDNPAGRSSSLRAFDVAANQFGLNMVELVADKQPDPNNSRTGYHIALGFGQAMNVVNGTDPGGLGFDQYLKEAYFSYLAPVGKGLQIDAGKFVTPAGAEVIETKDNWNYSRGLLFSYAIPFFHFGVRAKYTFNDKYAVAGYLVNGWNDIIDNNTGKTYGGSFFWNPTKKFGITQNYLIGPELANNNVNKRQLTDTVVTYSPTGKLSFIVNYDYGRGDRIPTVARPVFWDGVAGYVRYAFNSTNAFATRYEYFDDKYGVMTGGFTNPTPQHLHGFTGTYEHLLAHHVLTRMEFRRDQSSNPSFLKGTTPVMAQNTATVGLVYMFDTREGK